MSPDEHRILEFLKTAKKFVSAQCVSRGVGDPGRCKDEPNWAEPCLLRLAHRGLVIMNRRARFRYRAPAEARPTKPDKLHLAPHISEILSGSGRFTFLLVEHSLED